MSYLELLEAHRWDKAVFTTYALSLTFFEAMVLDRLVRSSSGQSTILSDVEGVRAALGEQGAQRIGRQYEVEPVSVATGVFHPKVAALLSTTETHLIVGSGNLTFGGWGINLEAAEHLYPEIAPDAFRDAANFFENLATAPHITHDAVDLCGEVAARLRQSVASMPNTGEIRLVHSLDVGIGRQLAEMAGELGGATRIVVASPFWDAGEGVDGLCSSLGLGEVYVHSHGAGSVAGRAGSNWPAKLSTKLNAIDLDVLHGDSRRLHAKLFELQCRNGRILMSGSANASHAALRAKGNVEACVVRIQKDARATWSFKHALPPVVALSTNDDEDRSGQVGVLRAVLDGETISGRVFTSYSDGPMRASLLAGTNVTDLGVVTIESSGHFSFPVGEQGTLGWTGGRLVLRLKDVEGRVVEGFIAVAAFAEISRRAGAMATKLIAILQGSEAPEDIAAVMEWFAADPSRMAWDIAAGGAVAVRLQQADRMIPIEDLARPGTSSSTAFGNEGSAGEQSWQRFMSAIWAAIREQRTPLHQAGGQDGSEEDEAEDSPDQVLKAARERQRSIAKFEDIFEVLLAGTETSKLFMAFDMAQFVAVRLSANGETVQKWIRKLVDRLTRVALPPGRSESVAAAVLALDDFNAPTSARNARARILRIGYDLTGPAPTSADVDGFLSRLESRNSLIEKWDQVRQIRTLSEQRRAYLHALDVGSPNDGYPDLPIIAPEQWPLLANAIGDASLRRRIDVVPRPIEACTRCYVALPTGDQHALKATGIAKGCHYQVIIVSGDTE